MNFEDIEKRFGFGLAVVIFEKELFIEFFKKLSFDQWLKIRKEASGDSPLRSLALEKMGETAKTFNQWLKVRKETHSNSPLSNLALEKMGRTAKTFKQWLTVWKEPSDNICLSSLAFKKMREA